MHRDDTGREIDELIRRSTQVEMPAEVETRLRGSLTEFRTRVEKLPAKRSPWWWMFRPPLRIAAMTAALVAAVALAMVMIPRESRAGRVFAAAAEQLRNSQSLAYTIVLNAEPYVAVDFSYLAPGYRRINCSWGIEVRTDGTTGNQIVLMHGARTYLTERGKQVESQANVDDFSAQLRSLPEKADEVLGEQSAGGRKLLGYRLRNAGTNGSLEIWIDPATGEPDHVDITIEEQGKPVHRMHIRDIRVGAEVNRAAFDLTPPEGYTAFAVSPAGGIALNVQVAMSAPLTAVVMPMRGPYVMARSALQTLESYLSTRGVAPLGAPFGRFESEAKWVVGYPVAPGARVEAPYQVVTFEPALTASAFVNAAWGLNSDARWAAFLKSVVDQGYVPAGPATEVWSGDEAKPANQTTEMRMAVAKAK